MPKGLPQSGDEGLDHTHTWGRTYWGGALFCFLADIEIRKQTQNKKGLQDALRGILNAGGDMREDWELEKALEAGDRAVGVDVLLKLYDQMRDHPMPVDLDALWKQLGIRQESGSVQFQDDAPLAAIRRSITEPRHM
jgi:predicted metalloprotease with PDZ domain